ncbi:MAG: DNA adenine methylase [Candidatus Thorarchaeota archaeon]|nr:DNA adenine methylase [Candidatus Thorarchaeota archaeon]
MNGKNNSFQESPRPIMKWAGGKRSLLPTLLNNLPSTFGDYYEPFFGGGAFYFKLYKEDFVRKATISDLNADLIWLYTVIRDKLNEFIDSFDLTYFVSTKERFYKIRSEFNRAKASKERSLIQAIRLMYLNKTCFNGLYRVNSKGEFNVPYGGYKNPSFYDEDNLKEVSKALGFAEIRCQDFETVVQSSSKGSFVYFDPPYAPLSDTADFTSYTKAGFSFSEQERLAKVFESLDRKGCFVMESNSATKAIRDLYSHFNILEVNASRAISADGSKRGKISELLITNYEATALTRKQTLLSDYG